MTTAYRVRVLDGPGFRAWVNADGEGNPFQVIKQKIGDLGETAFCWLAPAGGGPKRFMWVCPGCGSMNVGYLGDRPSSGWESPRWVNDGTPEMPALTPTLSCPLLRSGHCPGHWWLRDGHLTSA